MTGVVIPFPLRAANDNLPSAPPPSRETLRLGIILDWWERELRGLLVSRPTRRSSAYRSWRVSLDEAQARVAEFRGRMAEVA
jgi:hypothetical protein